MINLDYGGSTSSVILRLRQISQLSSPYYLFKLTNKNTKEDKYFTAADASVAPGLYQEFNIRNVGTSGPEDLENGLIFANPGEYLLSIYDSLYETPLSIASASNLLLYDVVRVHGSSTPIVPVNVPYQQTVKYVVYGQNSAINCPQPSVSIVGDEVSTLTPSVSLTASLSGGTQPYTYLWNNSGTLDDVTIYNPVATPTQSTTYTLTYNDSCSSTTYSSSIDIQVLLELSMTSSAVSCNGGSNGDATVTVVGGYQPYTYLWSDAQITNTATALVEGTYSVVVTDGLGQTASSEVYVSQPDYLTNLTIVNTDGSLSDVTNVSGSVGETLSPSFTYFAANTNTYLVFDVNTPANLYSFDVNSNVDTTGKIFELRDSSDTLLESISVNTTSDTDTTIVVNWKIPIGTGYRIKHGDTTGSWRRRSGGSSYPYTLGGDISITNSVLNGVLNTTNYYYFFNLTFTPSLAQITATPQDGTAPYTYLWDNAGTLTDATIYNPQSSAVIATNYEVVVTDACGITGSGISVVN